MLHERVVAVVPIVGTGTENDPKRPLFVPLPPRQPARGQAPVIPAPEPGALNNLISWNMVVSDDGRFALVEFIARDRKDLLPVLNANRVDVKAFERGKATKAEIEAELKKHKPSFKLEHLGGRQ
jgi:hypothetical protein